MRQLNEYLPASVIVANDPILGERCSHLLACNLTRHIIQSPFTQRPPPYLRLTTSSASYYKQDFSASEALEQVRATAK